MAQFKIYGPGDAFEEGKFPAFLAIGDSWFWYPKNNLVWSLLQHNSLKDDFRCAKVLGQNGAELSEYLDGPSASQLEVELSKTNIGLYSAVLISGGGNDAVAYSLALLKDCSTFNDAAACFNLPGLDTLISGMRNNVQKLIDQITAAAAKAGVQRPRIYVHGYDYAVPDNRGFQAIPGVKLLSSGPWLGSAMDQCKVQDTKKLRQEIVVRLIDELNGAFEQFNDPANRIHYINSRGVLDGGANYKNDWINELHPTTSGFDKIVDKKWIPELRKAGFAK